MKRIFNETLSEYCGKDYYPWHMPGHKRQKGLIKDIKTLRMGNEFDVTELPGLDNLNAPEASIAQSEQELTQVYGSYRSYYLVNGSTCGLLAAISACCKPGDTLIMARNCHKAVYHAVLLLGLKPVYLYPEILEEYKICSSISVEQVEEALCQNPEAKAVILTSPTYEGILSDVRSIAGIVHKAGVRLIVDEAHGAHMEFGADFPETAVRCGADVVIESLHKTLPCFTQCAILHVGKVKMCERIEQYLGIYQTSSPSYLFVANMEDAIAAMDEWRNTRMKEYYTRLSRYRRRWAAYEQLQLLTEEEVKRQGGYAYDCSKLVFRMKGSWSGEAFLKYMEDTYGLVFEMASLNYALAMTSIADTEEGFERLHLALDETEKLLQRGGRPEAVTAKKREAQAEAAREGRPTAAKKEPQIEAIEEQPEGKQTEATKQEDVVYIPAEAWRQEMEEIPFDKAAGRLAGDYVTVYPPGIPQLVPGERIRAEQVIYLRRCMKAGLTVYGITDGYIKVLKIKNI